MPDHCHFLLTPPNEGSISKIMHFYKRSVSFTIGKGSIWQRRFHCQIVRDHAHVMHYIYQNPVKAHLCQEPEQYVWSSASGKWDVTSLDWMGCYC